jgi:hypothetical protein
MLWLVPCGCRRGPDPSGPDLDALDLNSPQVQKAWLGANERKVLEILESKGFRVGEKSGESAIKVAEYSRHGEGVFVIFVDGKNDPPQLVTVAFLLPSSEDGVSWRIDGYISAFGTGKKMDTLIFEEGYGGASRDLSLQLDMFLSRHGRERKKFGSEYLLRGF